MVKFDLTLIQVLTLLVGTVLPILVNLVTTKVTSNAKKSLILLALAGVSGLLGELLSALKADVTYDLGAGLLFALTNFIIGVAMYHGLWKTTGVADKASDVLVTAKAEDAAE